MHFNFFFGSYHWPWLSISFVDGRRVEGGVMREEVESTVLVSRGSVQLFVNYSENYWSIKTIAKVLMAKFSKSFCYFLQLHKMCAAAYCCVLANNSNSILINSVISIQTKRFWSLLHRWPAKRKNSRYAKMSNLLKS